MKVIQITDPHLVAPGQAVWGADPAERLDRCLDDIARWHGDAAFCVISGDLTDDGDPAAYDWLRQRLAHFPLRCFLMLGNHDHRDCFRAAFPENPFDANWFVQYSHATDEGVFLFLDTWNGGKSSAGEYCQARLGWLAERLDEAGDRPVYIFMHHPPCDIGLPYLDRIKLAEAESFAGVLERARDLRHIFFGHVHRAVFTRWRGIALSAIPGTNHQVPLVRDSVDTAYSREPAAYGVILIDGDRTTVHVDACLDRAPVPGM